MSKFQQWMLRHIVSELLYMVQWNEFFQIVMDEAHKTYHEDNNASLESFLHERLAAGASA